VNNQQGTNQNITHKQENQSEHETRKAHDKITWWQGNHMTNQDTMLNYKIKKDMKH